MAGTLTVQNIEGPSSGANANTILIPSGQKLHAPGHVIQVVQGSTTTSTAIAVTSYTDVTLSASITPTSTSSKILVVVSQAGHVYSNQTSNRWSSMRIMRDTTQVHEVTQGIGGRGGLSTGSDRSTSASVSLTHLDPPSSASALTYKVQAKISNTDSNYTAQVSNSPSTITLMEIAQ